MLYVVNFKIHTKQTRDFGQGNKPNSYQTSEKKVPDPHHVMVIQIWKTKRFACGISNSENAA